MAELKPCPFCESTNISCADAGHKTDIWFVQCENCGATFPHFDSETEAVEAWNRRVENARKPPENHFCSLGERKEGDEMTPKEAIGIVRCAIGEVEWNYPLDYSIAFETAIEALEKQIPKKPRYVDTRFRHHGRKISDGSSLDKCYKCPNCNSHIFHVFDSEKCCKYCGQALDWSDNDA